MQRWIRIFVTVFVLAVSLPVPVDAQRKKKRAPAPRTATAVKRDQRATAREIKLTAEQIEENNRRTRKSLNELNSLNAEIVEHNASITALTAQVDSLDGAIASLGDSIASLDARLKLLRDNYARSVRKIHDARQGRMSTVTFLFSSESFFQAWRRMRYLREFSAWRQRKTDEISAMQTRLQGRREALVQVQRQRASSLAALDDARRRLKTKQEATSVIVAQLRREGSSLRSVLREKERRARALDQELDRIIQAEQRRQEELQRRQRQAQQVADNAGKSPAPSASSAPSASAPDVASRQTAYATASATRELTGTFESNKGKLLFPVTGRYRIVRPFGRNRHPDLPHVTTDNSGIDIEVPGGGSARAVFAGKVSAIFRQPGYNTIVMVRHGRYLTVYAGLSDISVKNGDDLRQGQTIGRIFADPDDDGRSILHFELRREKEKLNPALWVK